MTLVQNVIRGARAMLAVARLSLHKTQDRHTSRESGGLGWEEGKDG